MAIIKKYQAEVVAVKNSIEGVYTIEFRSLGKPFKYDPGQFLHLALDEYDPAGQWPDSRCFSMQSSPDEELITITYALKGLFTSRMERELKPGTLVTLKLPYGDLFTQEHNKANTVFIAGGTGITPYLSLFTHNSFESYTNPKIYLGFRSDAFNIYKKELSNLSNCNLTIYYEDKEGRLNINRITNENSPESTYFISGPPDMIKHFKDTLIQSGVPASHVLTDNWE